MRAYTLTVSGSTILSGSLDSASPVTASYFKGDGSAISGVSAEDPNAVVFSIVFGG